MSERKPFEPADGIEARWRKLYNLVLSKAIGDEITFREAEELCDCDRMAVLGAMDQAREHLLADGHLAVRTVAGFGWVRMSAAEQINFVGQRRQRAGRQVERGLVATVATQNHRDELSPFERERLDREQAALVRHVELMGRRKRSLKELNAMFNRQGEIAS